MTQTQSSFQSPLFNSTSEMSEILDDLDEIQFLIDGLNRLDGLNETRNATAAASRVKADFTDAFNATIEHLQQMSQNLECSVTNTLTAHSPKNKAEVFQSIQHQSMTLKLALRAAYRQRGSLACMLDWQSPWFASTIQAGSNRLDEGISAHVLDYKRDGHLDATAYEQKFVDEYARHLRSAKMKGYLTNSGMSAYMTILQFICPKLNTDDVVLALEPSYFENTVLLKRFLPKVTMMTPASGAECSDFLQEHQPSVIFCDIASNRGEECYHDVVSILEWAKTVEKEVTVVIDTTCMPCQLMPINLLENPGENVSVIFIESLAKHHQFGLDLVTGGMILAHVPEDLHAELKKARANFGSNITDVSVGSLPSPSNQILFKRLKRLSRNVELLASTLEQSAESPASPIGKVTWLRQGTAVTWFKGASFCVHFDSCCNTLEHYQTFLDEVLAEAASRNHPLVYGSSFGFDITRLYIINPTNPLIKPSVRVSVGTETQSKMEELAHIMLSVARRLGQKWHGHGKLQAIYSGQQESRINAAS